MYGISILEKITDEEKVEIENDFDSIEAPPGPYTVQPDVPGIKLFYKAFCIVLVSLKFTQIHFFRESSLVFWRSWNGEIYLSSDSGKREWIRLL